MAASDVTPPVSAIAAAGAAAASSVLAPSAAALLIPPATAGISAAIADWVCSGVRPTLAAIASTALVPPKRANEIEKLLGHGPTPAGPCQSSAS